VSTTDEAGSGPARRYYARIDVVHATLFAPHARRPETLIEITTRLHVAEGCTGYSSLGVFVLGWITSNAGDISFYQAMLFDSIVLDAVG